MEFYIKTLPGETAICLGDAVAVHIPALAGATDTFRELAPGVFRWDRVTEVPTNDMCMRAVTDYPLEFQLRPALQYQGNLDPTIIDYQKKRRIANNEPEDPKADNNYFKGYVDAKTGLPWTLAWWQSSVPGAVYSEGAGLSLALFLPPDQLDAASRVYPEGRQVIHDMVWPEQDMPRVNKPLSNEEPPLVAPAGIPGVIRSGKPQPWVEGYVCPMEPRDHFAVILVLACYEQPRTAWHKLMDVSWTMYQKDVPPKYTEDELWDLGIDFAKRLYGEEEEENFASTAFGLMYGEGAWVRRPMYRYELGWCGQAASLAVSLMMQGLLHDDPEAAQMGIKSLDSWMSRRLPNGIPPTHLYDQEYTHRGRKLIDACNLGEGAMQLFEAQRLARMLGYERPEYYACAKAICDFALSKMNEAGRMAHNWNEDDFAPVSEDSTSGCFLVMALLEGAANTGNRAYLDAAIRGYRYYYDQFISRGYTMGGAQDIYSIDKESAIPLLKSALRLYDLTGDASYVQEAEETAWYLATWQWCYTRQLRPGSSIEAVDYNSYGGTSVSIHGPGQDPYALFYVQEFYDLTRLTGDPRWAERAHAAWVNGMDGVSDGTMLADGRLIPRGGQHEARSVGRLDSQYLYQWLVAWPTAFRLELLRRRMIPLGDRVGDEL